MIKYKILIAVIALIVIGWLLSDGWKNYFQNNNNKPYVNTSEINGSDANSKRGQKSSLTYIDSLDAKLRRKNIPVELDDIIAEIHKDDDAGPLLLKAIEILKSEGDAVKEIMKYQGNYKNLTDVEKKRLRELLNNEGLKDVFELLNQASSMAAADFKVDYSKGPETQLPHLSHLRNFARLVAIKSKVDAEDGNIEEAIKGLNVGLKVSAISNDSMILINQLVGDASTNILLSAMQELKTGVALDKNTYQILEKQLYQMADNQIKSIDGERIIFGNYFKQLVENPQKFSDEIPAEILKKLTPENLAADYQFFLNYMVKFRGLLDSPNPSGTDQLRELERHLQENTQEYPLSGIIAPSISNMYSKYQEHQSHLKLNLISLKLEEYKQTNGQYPDSLQPLYLPDDILIESLTGKPFSYENGRLKANYVYRKGKNLELVIEDSGQ